jgi:hypothetical protein
MPEKIPPATPVHRNYLRRRALAGGALFLPFSGEQAMKVVTKGIGDLILGKMRDASEVNLAVAFFSPPPDVLMALAAVPSLKLVISDEFTINNPYKIEKLPSATAIRSIPTDADDGKLHAKVFIAKRRMRAIKASSSTYTAWHVSQVRFVRSQRTEENGGSSAMRSSKSCALTCCGMKWRLPLERGR